MANQAFALSPISARASLPSEEDYEAIREAFMETARGRWFLDEYASRNRNADTRMVLDAVARIEETLAAQKQAVLPVVVDRLPAALLSIRSAVEKAQGAASSAFDGLQLEQNLAPIRKGGRIIKEISWRWREIGADGRICDLIDSQVAAIDAACARLGETDPRVALRAAFEIIRSEIEAFRNHSEAEGTEAEAPAEPIAVFVPAHVPTPARVEPAARRAEADEELAASAVETAFNGPETPLEEALAEPEPQELSHEELSHEELSQQEADAQDEAVLEMVAAEMAAPDPEEVEEADQVGQADDLPAAAESELLHLTTPPVVEPIMSVVSHVEEVPQVEEPPADAPEPTLQPVLSAAPAVAPEPDEAPSLGATLIASGILRKHHVPANDPLAPIRRMSQAEKIAFFS
jgi:hypothetical protein